jgi:hypothetical protein
MGDQKIIPVAEISKNNGVVSRAIVIECENHKGCKVEKKTVDDVVCLIFPGDCDEDCRNRTVGQMNRIFGGA